MFVKIDCSSESSSLTIENPTGGGSGTIKEASTALGLTGCVVSSPTSDTGGIACTIHSGGLPAGSVSFSTEKGVLTEVEGKPSIEIPLLSAWYYGNAPGGSCPAILKNNNTPWTVTGTVTPTMNNAESLLTFNEPGYPHGLFIKGPGTAVSLVGTVKLETSAGTALAIAH